MYEDDRFEEIPGDPENPRGLLEEINSIVEDLRQRIDTLSKIPAIELIDHRADLVNLNAQLSEAKEVLRDIRQSIPRQRIENIYEGPLNFSIWDIHNLAVKFFKDKPELAQRPDGVKSLLSARYSGPDEWWDKEKYKYKTDIIIGTPERLGEYFDDIIERLYDHKSFDNVPARAWDVRYHSLTQKTFNPSREKAIHAIEEFRKYCYMVFGIEA